jgi:hypothetical protein
MPASSIYFNGRFTRVPGSYSEVDASGLDAVGLTASGYVAVIGTAIGGKPYSDIDNDDVQGTIQKSTRPGKAAGFFESGSDLLEAEGLLFNPSNDGDIEGGAQRVYWIKVNKSTQSTLAVSGPSGQAMVMTSEGYGWKTTRLNYEKGPGTNQGHMITLTLDATIEVLDDIGGDSIFTLSFTAPGSGNGYTTLTGQSMSNRLEAQYTKTMLGRDTEMAGLLLVVGYAAGSLVEIVSDNAGDMGSVTIYGVDETGAAISETVVLTGTTPVSTVDQYNEVHGARIDGAPAGSVFVRNPAAGANICILTSVNQTRGLQALENFWISGPASFVADAATGRRVSWFGTTSASVAADDVATLNGTGPVAGTDNTMNQVAYVALGMVQATRTLTMSGLSLQVLYATYDTVAKQGVRWNSFTGYTFTQVTAIGTYAMTSIDLVGPVNILSPSVLGAFTGDLAAIIAAINAKSELATVVKGTPGLEAPTDTTTALFFTGGHEGNSTPGQEATPYATAGDWQLAIDVLKKIFVNTLVPLTADAAVHAIVKAHCSYMAGAGRMERDAVVGLQSSGSLPTRTQIKSQVVALNTRHVRAVAQQCERYNAALTKVKMAPHYTACLVAGMQAGSSVGTSLTFKYANTLGVYGNSDWHPQDDGDEMLEMGLLFMETIDGVGFRWVRNITTYLIDSNLAYTEGSVNEATNYAAYNFRTQMETMVGAKGFTGTVQAAESVARQTLTLLMDDALTAWRSLAIELTLDVMEVDVEISPVLPVNFIQSTIHLVSTPLSAAS